MEEEKIGGDKITPTVWFIDTNVIAHWIMGKGGVLTALISKYHLSDDFHVIYNTRYSDSISLIELIQDKQDDADNEFYCSTLSMNELFAAVRDEVRAVHLFKKGVPLSRWRDSRIIPEISEQEYWEIYSKILNSFGNLFGNETLLLIDETSSLEEKQYFEIYSSLLFLIKNLQTQDATLLCTASFNNADYFVTKDTLLIKGAKNKMKNEYQLEIITPSHAIDLLR